MQRAEKGEMAAVVGEGSLRGMRVAAKLTDSPGSAPGFLNLKRRVARDVALSFGTDGPGCLQAGVN